MAKRSHYSSLKNVVPNITSESRHKQEELDIKQNLKKFIKPAKRVCLHCDKEFDSVSAGNRICTKCKYKIDYNRLNDDRPVTRFPMLKGDMLRYNIEYEEGGCFHVGDKFGCVHHTSKGD